MEYGILKIGDKVKYTDEAKREMPTVFKDITKYKTKTIKWISKNGMNCDFECGDSCDIYWLELVKCDCGYMADNNGICIECNLPKPLTPSK